MNREEIAKCGRRLQSRAPLLGGWLRRSACRRLAEDSSAATVPHLVAALESSDVVLREAAESALRSLRNPEAVDALCAAWAKGRDERLGRIVAECRYVARRPVKVRLQSAFKAGKTFRLSAQATGSLPLVIELLADPDSQVAKGAAGSLGKIEDPVAVDALCDLAIADPDGPAAAVVKEKDYQPQSVSRRCLLFVLIGELDRYFDLDFEFQHLRAEYRAGDEALKRRIGEVVRRSGDARLLGLFREVRRQKLAAELTEAEAAVVLDVHARNRQWPEIFALLFHIPLSSAVAALDVLAQSGWRPEKETEGALLDELLQARAGIGEVPERPAAPDVALGPVMGKWIDRGRGKEFAGQPEDALRQALAEAPPPDAVAALAALAASGKTTAQDVETARTHSHWPVRLACLALCEVAPQFAFSETPTGGEGGGLWVDRLAPAALDASVYRRRAVALNPDQLAALQAALPSAKGNPSARAACGRAIETLARHHLRHTIEVDETMTVQISETAIEVDG